VKHLIAFGLSVLLTSGSADKVSDQPINSIFIIPAGLIDAKTNPDLISPLIETGKSPTHELRQDGGIHVPKRTSHLSLEGYYRHNQNSGRVPYAGLDCKDSLLTDSDAQTEVSETGLSK
jgi:hypothetical protein